MGSGGETTGLAAAPSLRSLCLSWPRVTIALLIVGWWFYLMLIDLLVNERLFGNNIINSAYLYRSLKPRIPGGSMLNGHTSPAARVTVWPCFRCLSCWYLRYRGFRFTNGVPYFGGSWGVSHNSLYEALPSDCYQYRAGCGSH